MRSNIRETTSHTSCLHCSVVVIDCVYCIGVAASSQSPSQNYQEESAKDWINTIIRVQHSNRSKPKPPASLDPLIANLSEENNRTLYIVHPLSLPRFHSYGSGECVSLFSDPGDLISFGSSKYGKLGLDSFDHYHPVVSAEGSNEAETRQWWPGDE